MVNLVLSINYELLLAIEFCKRHPMFSLIGFLQSWRRWNIKEKIEEKINLQQLRELEKSLILTNVGESMIWQVKEQFHFGLGRHKKIHDYSFCLRSPQIDLYTTDGFNFNCTFLNSLARCISLILYKRNNITFFLVCALK